MGRISALLLHYENPLKDQILDYLAESTPSLTPFSPDSPQSVIEIHEQEPDTPERSDDDSISDEELSPEEDIRIIEYYFNSDSEINPLNYSDDKIINAFIILLAENTNPNLNRRTLKFIKKHHLGEDLRTSLILLTNLAIFEAAIHQEESALYQHLDRIRFHLWIYKKDLLKHFRELPENNLFKYRKTPSDEEQKSDEELPIEPSFGPLEYEDGNSESTQLLVDWQRYIHSSFVILDGDPRPIKIAKILADSTEEKKEDETEIANFKTHEDVTNFFGEYLFHLVEDSGTKSLLIQEAARHFYQSGITDAPLSLLMHYAINRKDRINILPNSYERIFTPLSNGVNIKTDFQLKILATDQNGCTEFDEDGEAIYTPMQLHSEIDFRCEGQEIIIDVKDVRWETEHPEVLEFLRDKTMENENGQPYREEVFLQEPPSSKLTF